MAENWAMQPHDINYPIKNSQAATNLCPSCGFLSHCNSGLVTGRIPLVFPWKRNFCAVKAEIVLVFCAKWHRFSPHYVFVCVCSQFARPLKKPARNRESTMENFPTRSITIRMENTMRSTITKHSWESKRNLSISWLRRNPKKGLGKMKCFLFRLMCVFSRVLFWRKQAAKREAELIWWRVSNVIDVRLWMPCFNYQMLICSCQYSKCCPLWVNLKKFNIWSSQSWLYNKINIGSGHIIGGKKGVFFVFSYSPGKVCLANLCLGSCRF